jgi:dTDP-4-dehydrorhamnose reductase
MTRDLATRGQHDHPVLNVPGWWRRSDRFGSYTQQAMEAGVEATHRLADTRYEAPRRVLIVDGDASLAAVFSATCSERHIPAVVIDASDAGDIGRIVDQGDIWAVILAAQDCFGATSPAGPNEVAALCVTQDIRFACFSSASGAADTKEQYIAVCSNGLVVLTEPLVAPKVARDTDASSSFTRDLANVAIDLLIDGERGIWHLHRSGEASRNAGPLLHLGEHSRSRAADD